MSDLVERIEDFLHKPQGEMWTVRARDLLVAARQNLAAAERVVEAASGVDALWPRGIRGPYDAKTAFTDGLNLLSTELDGYARAYSAKREGE